MTEGENQVEMTDEVLGDIFAEFAEGPNEGSGNGGDSGHDNAVIPVETTRPMEARLLLVLVRVSKMKAWEIAMALKYPFIRECSGIVISFAQRLLSISGNSTGSFVCDPIRRDKLESNKPFTFTFKVNKNEVSSDTWEFKETVYSPWTKDEATGRKWRLKIKENERDGKYISVHVILEGNSIKINKYEVFLLRNNPWQKPPYYQRAMNRTINPGRGYGFRRFISLESLFKEGSELISSDPESTTFGANIFQDFDDSSSSESED